LLQAVRKRDFAGCDEWPADLELNLSVPEKGDRGRVAGEAPSIEERRDAMLRTDLLAIEGLPPDVEEVARACRCD